KAAMAAVPLHDAIVGSNAATLGMLFVAVLMVLLLVAVNLTGLFLARAASRRRELAVRIAMGADRATVVRQLVAESLVPAALAGAVGLLFGQWGARLLLGLAPTAVPRANEVGVNGDVALFAVSVTALTGVAIGLVPALQTRRLNPSDDLRGGGRATDAA